MKRKLSISVSNVNWQLLFLMPKPSVSMKEEGLQESSNVNNIWHTLTFYLCSATEKGGIIIQAATLF